MAGNTDKPGSNPVLVSPDLIRSNMICAFCNSLAYRPRKRVQTSTSSSERFCNHSFCFSCLEILNGQGAATCLICEARFDNIPLTEPDLDLQQTISDLQVKCPNEVYGCTPSAQLTLKDLPSHYLNCPFTTGRCADCGDTQVPKAQLENGQHKTPCTFSCQCGKKVAIKDKEFHSPQNCMASLLEVVPAPASEAPLPKEWESALVDPKKTQPTVDSCLNLIASKRKDYLGSLTQAFQLCRDSLGANPVTPSHESLSAICQLYASAIEINTETKKLKGGPLDATLHLGLGLSLEETILAIGLFPKPTSVQSNAKARTEVNEESMNDEFNGLLMSLGVPSNAANGIKLQAIEDEYHRLLGQNLSDQVSYELPPENNLTLD